MVKKASSSRRAQCQTQYSRGCAPASRTTLRQERHRSAFSTWTLTGDDRGRRDGGFDQFGKSRREAVRAAGGLFVAANWAGRPTAVYGAETVGTGGSCLAPVSFLSPLCRLRTLGSLFLAHSLLPLLRPGRGALDSPHADAGSLRRGLTVLAAAVLAEEEMIWDSIQQRYSADQPAQILIDPGRLNEVCVRLRREDAVFSFRGGKLLKTNGQ
eukprot:2985611-Rhodomonas_salina.1